MQSFALPGVFSGIIAVAFHLAGVQRLPHLAQSTHDPFPGQPHKHPSSSSLDCREISTQNNDMIHTLHKGHSPTSYYA